MSDSATKDASACGGGCAKCGALDQCDEPRGGPTGVALVGWSALVFGLPLVTATAGAIIAGSSKAYQFAGAFVGLAAGLVVGMVAAKLANPSPKEKA